MICKKHEPKECEDCLKEKLAKLEEQIKEIKDKLPKKEWISPFYSGCMCYHATNFYTCNCYCHRNYTFTTATKSASSGEAFIKGSI